MNVSPDSDKRVAVIGAGPAGMTAAYQLAKAGISVEVFEASDAVGGLARSMKLWGQTVDLGPHRFFSRDRRVNELWLEVVGDDYRMVDRLTRILYRRTYFHYPLQAGEALRKLGPMEAGRCLTAYAREWVRPTKEEGNFEAWVTRRFGRRLFEIFFKSYSEKLWGIGCDELDADFAAQRIKKFSLFEALKNAAFSGSNAHATLVDRFAYPIGGTGMVYERMAEAVRRGGGAVRLRTPVGRVVTENGRVTGIDLPEEGFRPYDEVISSMPLTALVARLPEAPEAVTAACRRLTFRNTILVYLEVASGDVCRDNWLYVHSPDLLTGRITNFRNWAPELYGDSPNTILAMEYWCNDDETLWAEEDEALVARAKTELLRTGLVTDPERVRRGHVVRIPKCYPVYRRGYRDALAPVEAYLRSVEGLQVIGRYGAFKYNNQDHSVLMGALAAENVLSGADNDLWGVNADYETYQESSRITDTGLVNEPVSRS